MTIWKLNTSNPNKYEEFKRLFANYRQELEATHIDLPEIAADHVRVIAHKASQLEEGVLVEDTSLEVEGAAVGIQVKWLLDHLPNYIGSKARWIVLLAYRKNHLVFIHQGVVSGMIVEAKGAGGFGFDPVFLPDGASLTLAQSKPDSYNARAKAVKALLEKEVWSICPTIEYWEGPWQDFLST